jgi:hypothetical protein
MVDFENVARLGRRRISGDETETLSGRRVGAGDVGDRCRVVGVDANLRTVLETASSSHWGLISVCREID